MNLEEIIRHAQTLDESMGSLEKLYQYLLERFDLNRPIERSFQKNGVLITFDGHSGAGKDTQMALLKKHIQKSDICTGHRVVELIQKRSDPFRQVPKYLWGHPELQSGRDCSLLLLTTGRKYFIYNTLLPLLEDQKTIVLQNRSYLSHTAYHVSNVDELSALIALSDFDPKPDLTFILECDVNTAYSRVVERSPQKGGMIYNNERTNYIERVKRNFRGLANLVPDLIFIDTSMEPIAIAQGIYQKVDSYLRQRK